MIKVIKDFLPKTLFNYMKLLVESENDMSWNFNPTNLLPGDKTPGAENYKLAKNRCFSLKIAFVFKMKTFN